MADDAVIRDAVSVVKTNSLPYLHAVFDCYRKGRVVIPADGASAAVPGVAITERVAPAAGGGWFQVSQPVRLDPTPAQVSFTSGTTGEPKAVVLSHRALGDVTNRLVEAMDLDAAVREYVGVPVTFSFGLGRARAAAAVGGAVFLPADGFQTAEFAEMLRRGEVNALSAVPTLLRVLLLDRDLFAGIGGRLRWLEIGSQYMSGPEKQAVRELFPAARIVQHYGLTEASRTTFLAVDRAAGEELESVGRPTGVVEVRVGADGRVGIRGPHVADGVLTADGLVPLADRDGWLTTNDVGRLDPGGLLFYQGRADDLINVGGVKVPAELFERRLAELLGGGSGFAVAGRPDPLRGEGILVARGAGSDVRPDDLRRAAGAAAATFGLRPGEGVTVADVPVLPVTATGKVQRRALTAAFVAQQAAAASAPPPVARREDADGAPRTPAEKELAAIWSEVLGVSPVGRDETFFDLGGDSLSAIRAVLRMERAGIPKEVSRQILNGRTIAEIAEAAGEGAGGAGSQALAAAAINAARGVLVLVVLAAHWLPFFFARAGDLGPSLFRWANPFFRFGTPGFAIVFGIGQAYFQYPTFRRSRGRFRARVRANALLVGGGVLVLALLRAAELALGPDGLGPQWPTRTLYSVLLFYLVMILSSGLVFRVVAAGRPAVLSALLVAVGAFGLSAALRAGYRDAEADGWVNLARLMLVANYSYVELLGDVMLGMAVGLWVRDNQGRPDLAGTAAKAGLVLFGGGVILSVTTGTADRWFTHPTASHPAVIAYCGLALLLFAGAHAIGRRGSGGPARVAVRSLAVLGTLAFPAYIGHELLPEVKGILVALGTPNGPAVGLSLALFVVPLAVLFRKVYKMYY